MTQISYIISDDSIATGITLENTMKTLTGQGVPEENIWLAVLGMQSSRLLSGEDGILLDKATNYLNFINFK